MRDPELEIRVNPRAFGTYSFKVTDPAVFIGKFIGQSGAVDPDVALQWVRDQILMGLKSVLTRMMKSGDITLMDLGECGPDVARAGLHTLVLEAHPDRPGGAVGSVQSTRPGFVHDVGAAFFPWGTLSPAFRELDLVGHGLQWCEAELESCHPAPDGSFAVISRDHEVSARNFGSPTDGDAWRRIARWYASIEPHLLPLLMETFPAVRPMLRLLPLNLLKVASVFLSRGRGLSERWFRSEAARRVLPGLALQLPVTALWNYPTVVALADFLAEQITSDASPEPPSEPADPRHDRDHRRLRGATRRRPVDRRRPGAGPRGQRRPAAAGRPRGAHRHPRRSRGRGAPGRR